MANTKLDAINSCLRGIGAQPVAPLEDANLDAGLAEQTIDAVLLDVLSRGWWFNREPNWKLIPNEQKEIYVPNNVIDIVPSGDDRLQQVTIRSRKLYDVENHTFNMSKALDKHGHLYCTFLVNLDFEDIPSVARRAVTYIARRLFAQDLEVDQARWTFQKEDEQKAIVMLERAEARQRKHNYTNNPATSYFLSRVGGRNSRSGYFQYAGRRGEVTYS